MPLVGCESFDWTRTGGQGVSEVILKQPPWAALANSGGSGIVAGAGRNGTQGLRMSPILGLLSVAVLRDRWVVGFSFKVENNYPVGDRQQLLVWYSAGKAYAVLMLAPDGRIEAYTINPANGARTLRATASAAWDIGVEHYFEARITGGASGGIVVRRDEQSLLSWSGNPGADGTPAVSQFDTIRIGGSDIKFVSQGGTWVIDDVVLLAGIVADTDFWGDHHVRGPLPPDRRPWGGRPPARRRTGRPSMMSPMTATRPTSRRRRPRVLRTSIRSPCCLPISARSVPCRYIVFSRKTDAGTANIQIAARSGGTTSYAGSRAVPTSYTALSAVWETDPATGSLWTHIGVDNAQFGMRTV